MSDDFTRDPSSFLEDLASQLKQPSPTPREDFAALEALLAPARMGAGSSQSPADVAAGGMITGASPFDIATIIAPGAAGTAVARDMTPPGPPTLSSLTSNVVKNADGSSYVRIVATVVHPSDADLFATYVELTADNDGAVPTPAPVWTQPSVILIGKEKTQGELASVRGVTTYWGRASSVDVSGNRSTYSSTQSVVTAADLDAPAQPQQVEVISGYRGFATAWLPGTAPDLMFYEVRYAPDDGSGTGPDTTAWVDLHVRSNALFVGDLDPNQKYWVQVRAVDFSGNVVTSSTDSTAVNYIADAEAGYTAQLSVTPSLIGTTDIAANSIISNHIATAGLSADVIKSGNLQISTSDATKADGILVYLSGVLIGRWDDTGLYIYDHLDATNYVRVNDAGITIYKAGVVVTAITPDGINASAINFGVAPGGHNVILNSSFELTAFVSAATTKTWDLAADWNGTRIGTDTNVTTGTNDLSVTALTY